MQTLTLAELIRAKANELRGINNEAGDMMSQALLGLALDVEFFKASSPVQYAERKEAWDSPNWAEVGAFLDRRRTA
jgi:hypothetical protein